MSAEQRQFVKVQVSERTLKLLAPEAEKEAPFMERMLALRIEGLQISNRRLSSRNWQLRQKAQRKDVKIAALRADLNELDLRLKHALRELAQR